MSWTLISNISAITTCTAFILYLIGHIWAIHISKNKILEKIEFEYCAYVDLDKCFNLAGEYGQIFSVYSPEGIRNIKIYEATLSSENINAFTKGNMLKEIKDLAPNKKQYIRAEFSDLGSNFYMEIERADYIKTSFVVTQSGKDGSLIQSQYKSKMTFTSWIYYLCK